MPAASRRIEKANHGKVFRQSERMVGRRIAGEYVLVPIVGRGADVEAIYNLNGLGAFIWEQLDGARTGEAVVQAIVDRYEVDREMAESDYETFLDQLLTIQAVTPVGPLQPQGAGGIPPLTQRSKS